MVIDIYNSSTSQWVSLLPYIAYGGIKWSRNDLDGPNAGRSLDGLMIRDKIGSKDKLEITFRPMKTDETAVILPLLDPEFVQVRYLNPYTNSTTTKVMYCSASNASRSILKGEDYWWDGISANLIEK